MPLDDGRDDDDDDDDGTGDKGIPTLNSPNSVSETLSAFSAELSAGESGTDITFCFVALDDASFDDDCCCDDEGIPTLSSPISVMINTGISFFPVDNGFVEPRCFFQVSHNELNDCPGF